MPELKHSFTAGRMNKDLDERLVSNGEYRDALNVEINTSEGSNLGAVQNTMGNLPIQGCPYPSDSKPNWNRVQEISSPNLGISITQQCVGSVVDSKNDKLYYLVASPPVYDVTIGTNQGQQLAPSPFVDDTLNDIYVDYISEFNTFDQAGAAGITYPVLVDIHTVIARWYNALFTDAAGTGTTTASSADEFIYLKSCEGIEVGMVASSHNQTEIGTIIGIIGTGAGWQGCKVQLSTTIEVMQRPLVWVFTQQGGRVLNFSQRGMRTREWPKITGINIVDDMLFWTDGYTEPKKINIKDSKAGCGDWWWKHTRLGPNLADPLVNKKHVTVIRKNPPLPPNIEMKRSHRNPSVFVNHTAIFDFTNPVNGALFPSGTPIEITGVSTYVPYEVGDVLVMEDNSVTGEVFTFRVRVTSAPPAGSSSIYGVVLSVDTAWLSVGSQHWDISLEEPNPLYELKFVRFAYRYKYKDGELSAISPFSEVAFLPGAYGYETQTGYNLGMVNTMKSLYIKDWVLESIPEDVVAVELLYKESDSPNIYTLKTFESTTPEFNASGTGSHDGVYRLEKDLLHGVLPSNQLLRPWDNVPLSALAQEVVGNRIVYGNYLQNLDISASESLADFDISLNSYDVSTSEIPHKSIKSLRTYQLGVVYRDFFGRETPVITNKDASIKSEKVTAHLRNQLSVSLNHPNLNVGDIKSFKFFVKETSTEYYNLAMDRWYGAEDSNIWISFPDEDRNKVDEETTLILKKQHDNHEPVIDNVKYKVLSIKNEAPEYIKTTKRTFGKIESLIMTASPFANSISIVPVSNTRTVVIDQNHWKNSTMSDARNVEAGNGAANAADEGTLQIRFFGTEGESTPWMDVSTIVHGSNGLVHINENEQDIGETSVIITTDQEFEDSDWLSPSAAVDDPKIGIKMELARKVVENKPEFDGRFFVKVLNDELLQKYIENTSSQTDDTYISKTASISYLNGLVNAGIPSTSGAPNQPTYNAAGMTGFMVGAQPYHSTGSLCAGCTTPLPPANSNYGYHDDGTYTGWRYYNRSHADWAGLLDDVGLSAGMPYLDTNTASHNPTPGANETEFEDHGAKWMFFIDAEPVARPFGYSSLNPMPNGYDSKGIGTLADYNNTRASDNAPYCGVGAEPGETVMHISFIASSHEEARNTFAAGYWEDFSTLQGSIDQYAIRKSPGRFNKEAGIIADKLSAGQKFKWKNDPSANVYTIVSVQVQRYWGSIWIPDLDGLPATTIETEADSGRIILANPRIRYKLTLDRPLGEDASGAITEYIPTYHGAGSTYPNNRSTEEYVSWTASTSASSTPSPFTEIQFIDSLNDPEHRPKMSTNPAIFETEPKDNNDLDIYHEVGQAYPTRLTKENAEEYIRVGDVVTVVEDPDWGNQPGGPPTNCNPGQERTVTAISGQGGQGFAGGLPATVITLSSPTDFTSGLMPLNPTVIFTHPHDGSSVTAKFQDYYDTTFKQHYSNIAGAMPTAIPNTFVIDSDIINAQTTQTLPWYNCYSFGNGVESNRVRDTFNSVSIDKGPKVSSTLNKVYEPEKRKYGLIYSGLYNSTSGVNDLNQFIQAEKITKDINPTYGSIQKLFTRNTDLVALCEDKILKILANKDAVYNADGNAQLTSTNNVLGQTVPYAGDYGISRNPESFASESHRAYFTDRQRGAVLRLSQDGLTAISDKGMEDWFKDEFKASRPTGADFEKMLGSYDERKSLYNLTIKSDLWGGGKRWGEYSGLISTSYVPSTTHVPTTLSFSERSKGWVSFKSFIPEDGISLNNEYFTMRESQLWHHHANVDRNVYYGEEFDSSIKLLVNEEPSIVKNFRTISYEGSQARITENDLDENYYNINEKRGWYVESITTDLQDGANQLNDIEFKGKEGKWFSYIKGDRTFFDNITGDNNLDTSEFSMQGIGKIQSVFSDEFPGCMDQFGTFATSNGDPFNSPYPGIPVAPNNYDPNATIPDYSINAFGGCFYTSPLNDGCTDPLATNYDPAATSDDGSCVYVTGCTDPTANNFDPTAVVDDGSCTYDTPGCMYGGSIVGDASWWGSSSYSSGITQPVAASNYNFDCSGAGSAGATIDDGCCEWDCCDVNTWIDGVEFTATGTVVPLSGETINIIDTGIGSPTTPVPEYAHNFQSTCPLYGNGFHNQMWKYSFDGGANWSDVADSNTGGNSSVYTPIIASSNTYILNWDTITLLTNFWIDHNGLSPLPVQSSYLLKSEITFDGGSGSCLIGTQTITVAPEGTVLADYLVPQHGCTECNSVNFDPLATVDDGSCTIIPFPYVSAPDSSGNYDDQWWEAGVNESQVKTRNTLPGNGFNTFTGGIRATWTTGGNPNAAGGNKLGGHQQGGTYGASSFNGVSYPSFTCTRGFGYAWYHFADDGNGLGVPTVQTGCWDTCDNRGVLELTGASLGPTDLMVMDGFDDSGTTTGRFVKMHNPGGGGVSGSFILTNVDCGCNTPSVAVTGLNFPDAQGTCWEGQQVGVGGTCTGSSYLYSNYDWRFNFNDGDPTHANCGCAAGLPCGTLPCVS